VQYIYLRLPKRTSKLQKKPQTLQRKHTKLKNREISSIFLVGHFAWLDLEPDETQIQQNPNPNTEGMNCLLKSQPACYVNSFGIRIQAYLKE
jgi:hypothetical protein